MNRVTLRRRVIFSMLFACLMSSSAALSVAQTSPFSLSSPLPSAADPSHLRPVPKEIPPPSPDTASPPPAAAMAPRSAADIIIEGAETVSFKFHGVIFSGMTAYKESEFTPLFADIVGRSVSLSEVINRINGVARRYHQDGYILAQMALPEQDITAGLIRVEVIEGRIGAASVVASPARAVYLTSYVAPLLEPLPFRITDLEQHILLLNQLPGAKFKSVLHQSSGPAAKVGEIDIALIEEKEKPGSEFEISNSGSRYAGPWQASVNFSDASLFMPYDLTSLRLATTQQTQELKSASLSYQAPIYAVPGLFLTAHASYGRTESGANLRELGIHGLSREAALGLRYTHLLSRKTNWVSEASLSYNNISSKILGSPLYDDRTRVATLTSTVQHLDSFRGVSLATLQLSQGLDILGARKTGSENLSREDGESNFRKVAVQFSRVQDLPFRFQGLVQINGQYSLSNLLSSEEFGFGGRNLGRGLDPSEITGDHGIAAAFELRYNGIKPFKFLSLRPYTFIDAGKVWQKGINAGNPTSAVTVGLGSKFSMPYDVDVDIYAAIPLTYASPSHQAYGNGESPRYLLFITKRF